jgi:hypothetical protein
LSFYQPKNGGFREAYSAAPATSGASGVSRAEAAAALLRELASRRTGEGPPPGVRPEAAPEAAAQAAGADGKKRGCESVN